MTTYKKSRINSLHVAYAVVALGSGTWTTGAMAATIVQATLANGKSFAPLLAAGNFNVSAYSEQMGVKNAAATPTVISNTRTIAPLANPRPNVAGYFVVRNANAILVPGSPALGPTAAITNNIGPGTFPKGMWLIVPNDQATITSATGQYTGQGSAFIDPSGVGRIAAFASVAEPLPPPPGAAAGRAVDPISVPSGSPLAYAPALNGSIQISGAGVSGGTLYWAVDSSVFTSDSVQNFADDGAPLDQTLWYLTMDAKGPVASTSGVDVDFELNPLALNEIAFPSSFLAGLAPYSDAVSEAALIDQAIDQAVDSALSFSGGIASLSPEFDPFPDGTVFNAAAGGVEYADGVDAGLVGVPEPGTIGLLLLGSIGAAMFRWRPGYRQA